MKHIIFKNYISIYKDHIYHFLGAKMNELRGAAETNVLKTQKTTAHHRTKPYNPISIRKYEKIKILIMFRHKMGYYTFVIIYRIF